VWPNAIPSMVGITLAPHDFLIVYLTGAAELAAAVLSFGAMRLSDVAALRLVVITLVVMHGASGVLNLVYMAQTGWGGVLIANTCARAAAVAVLLGAWFWSVRRAHHT